MQVLVTGCSGFLGTNMVRILREKGHSTVGIDIEKPAFDRPDIFFQGNICDKAFVENVLAQCDADAVIHLAAVSTIQAGQADPVRTWEVNVGGTQNLLDVLRGSKTVLLFASTDKVYGVMNGQAAYQEQTSAICPVNYFSYDCSKAEADRRVLQWSREGCGSAIVFRFCNLYGAFDRNLTRIVPGSIYALFQGKSAILRKFIDEWGNCQNYFRDMLYAGDWAEAVCRVLKMAEEGTHTHMLGQAYNLGSTGMVSMEEVLKQLYQLMALPYAPEIAFSREPEIPIQHTDYTMAQQAFGFTPRTTLAGGLQKTIAWWRAYEQSCGKGMEKI